MARVLLHNTPVKSAYHLGTFRLRVARPNPDRWCASDVTATRRVSTAPTYDEQGHIVDCRTRLAEPGNIL
jgi:hypothetical protein